MPLFKKDKKHSSENDGYRFNADLFPFLIDDSFAPPEKKEEPKPVAQKEEKTVSPVKEDAPVVLEVKAEPTVAPITEKQNEKVKAAEVKVAVSETKKPTTEKKETSNVRFSSIASTAAAPSPLQSVLNSVRQTAAEVKTETKEEKTPQTTETHTVKTTPKHEVKPMTGPVVKPEPKKEITTQIKDETKPMPKAEVAIEIKYETKPEEKPEVKTETKKQPAPSCEVVENTAKTDEPPVKTSTLLAKCMPYIYDDDGINYVEEKPNYKLESVEDIIASVEKKAGERIARMYGKKTAEVEVVSKASSAEMKKQAEEAKETNKNDTAAKPAGMKIGQEVKPSSAFDTASFPKISGTLLDDFSSRRTEMSDTGPITTTYTQFNNMQSDAAEGHTRVLPDLKLDSNTAEIFEDISSHSSATDATNELPRFSHKPDIDYAPDEIAEDTDIDDFCGAEDIKRVGSDLKFNMLACRLRLIVTAVLTLLAGFMHLSFVKEFFAENPLFAGITGLVIFGLAAVVNTGVFTSLKTAFTKAVKIEVPLAFALILMGCYLIFETVSANSVFEVVILPLISLLVYTFCSYLKHNSVWNNFKLVALRKPKTAVALISDPSTTYAMARSIIDGEILAVGSRETDEIGDFLKNSYTERTFSGHLNSFTFTSLIISVIVGAVIGINHLSFSDGFCAAASALCLAAAPSLFIADMLPFAGLSRRLRSLKAAVCSKYSAERIELLNAVVLSSADIFPDDCIKLYSMRPLSSNNLDETIALAAAVANEANSPLKNLFLGMLSDGAELPKSDSVKYEDNLGISGWANDHHIMIGNRSIMEAHGVRVPALEVDRKILHKGFFPVYVACDQRACALLTVKYTIDREVEYELGRLADKGVTILVENCDPNINEDMLCDYYSLYPDIVKVLDHHGVGKYNAATSKTDIVSAHGFYKDSPLGFISMLNGCIRLRTVSNVLAVVHIISAVLCWLVYTGVSISGTMALIGSGLAALCSIATLILSLITYFIGKP